MLDWFEKDDYHFNDINKSPGSPRAFLFYPLARNTMTTESIHFNIQRELIRLFAQADAWFDRDISWLTAKPLNEVSAAARLACLHRSAHHYLDKRNDTGSLTIESIVAEQWTDFFDCIIDPLETTELSVQQLKNMRGELRDLLDRSLCTLELLELTTADRSMQYFNFTALLLHGQHQLRAIQSLDRASTDSVIC